MRKNAATNFPEENVKDDRLGVQSVIHMDADYSDHRHVWSVAMLVSQSGENEQGSQVMITASINNFGAVVGCHSSRLEATSAAGLLAVHDRQGRHAVDWGHAMLGGERLSMEM